MLQTGRFMPGAVSHTPTSSLGFGYGNGFSSTPFSTPKITAFAPMPTASVMIVTMVKSGARPRRRRTCLSCEVNVPIGSLRSAVDVDERYAPRRITLTHCYVPWTAEVPTRHEFLEEIL